MFIKLQPLFFFIFKYTFYVQFYFLFLPSFFLFLYIYTFYVQYYFLFLHVFECYHNVICSYAQLIHFLVIYPILLYCNLHFLYMSTRFIDFNLPTSIRTLYILPFIFIVRFIFSSLFQYRHQSIQHRNFCNTSQSLDW